MLFLMEAQRVLCKDTKSICIHNTRHSQNGSTNDVTNPKIQGIKTEQMLNYKFVLKIVTNISEKPASSFFRLFVAV